VALHPSLRKEYIILLFYTPIAVSIHSKAALLGFVDVSMNTAVSAILGVEKPKIKQQANSMLYCRASTIESVIYFYLASSFSAAAVEPHCPTPTPLSHT